MNIRHFLSLSTAIVLSACGGSGGGAPGATVPPPPPPPVGTGLVIDQTNAKPAVRVAYGASLESQGSGEALTGPAIAASPVDDGFTKTFANQAISDGLIRVFQKDPLPEVVNACPGPTGGTETINQNVAVPDIISAGDRVVVEYLNCDNDLGEILNGTIDMTIAVYSENPLGLFMLDANVLLVDFEVTTATDSIVSNGDSTVSIDMLGFPTIVVSINGNMLTTVSPSVTDVITNFMSSQSVNALDEMYTLTTSGTVDSSQLDGIISYSTPDPFQGVGVAYPFFGQLLITGDGPAVVRLIAENDSMVTIEVDMDGDGIAESTELTTWDDIAL